MHLDKNLRVYFMRIIGLNSWKTNILSYVCTNNINDILKRSLVKWEKKWGPINIRCLKYLLKQSTYSTFITYSRTYAFVLVFIVTTIWVFIHPCNLKGNLEWILYSIFVCWLFFFRCPSFSTWQISVWFQCYLSIFVLPNPEFEPTITMLPISITFNPLGPYPFR